MKMAKVIIYLQVLFLAVTIIFSTGIAYNSAQQDAPLAIVATNLALNLPYEVADPARNQFQEQLRAMDSMQRALEAVSQGQVPEGATEIAEIPGAFLVPFTVDAQPGASQAKESALVVMSAAEIAGLQLDGALSAIEQGVNVYLPPAGSIQDAINAHKASSAGDSRHHVPISSELSGVTGYSLPTAAEKLRAGELLVDAKTIDMPGANRLLLVPIIGQRDGAAFLAMSTHDQTAEIAAAVQKDDDLSRQLGVFVGRPSAQAIESILKTSSSGLVIPVITLEQRSRVIEDARQNLGVIGQGIIPSRSLLRTFRFESPVFQKRDVVQVNPETGARKRITVGPITVDNELLAPETGVTQINSQDSVRTFGNLAAVVAMPELLTTGPSSNGAAYYMFRGLFASEKDMEYAFDDNHLRFDITVIRPAVIGRELVHTSGHYHNPLAKPEIYMVVSGKAVYLLQQHKMPIDADTLPPEQFKKKLAASPVIRSVAIIAQPGQPVVIPSGWGHVTVNPSLTEPVIMANWLTHNQESMYGVYETLQGPSHRIMTTGEGRGLNIIPNDNYPEDIPFMLSTPKDVGYLGLVTGQPLYDIINDIEAFKELSMFLNTGKVSGKLEIGELAVTQIDTVEAAELLGVPSVDMLLKSSSAGHEEDIAAALALVVDAERGFTDASRIADISPEILQQYTGVLNQLRDSLGAIRGTSPEAAAAVSNNIKQVNASIDVIDLSTNMATEIAKIDQVEGTIVINESEIPSNQPILLSMLDKSSPYLQALETKLGCKVRLLSQYNSKTDGAPNMVVISSTAVEGITKRINVQSITQGGYLPLEHIIVLAKGLLAYNKDTRPVLDGIISQMYRYIAKVPLVPGLLDAFLQSSVFLLDLPAPIAIDEAYYEQLHRQALAALIAA